MGVCGRARDVFLRNVIWHGVDGLRVGCIVLGFIADVSGSWRVLIATKVTFLTCQWVSLDDV